jgi:isoleucyl-tRNA synthetase
LTRVRCPTGSGITPSSTKTVFTSSSPPTSSARASTRRRGWFYSLMAISTFLSGRSSFKSVLVNDLVLDKDGQKMSKSKGNVVDPWDMIDKFGVDALRWYLVAGSPPWVPTRFDEDGVREVASRFFGTLLNVYAFFTLYANIDGIDPNELLHSGKGPARDRQVGDLADELACEGGPARTWSPMSSRKPCARSRSSWWTKCPTGTSGVTERRFWSNEFDLDKKAAYVTLHEVLLGVAKMMAPFAPYLAEDIYLNLTQGKALESVHFASTLNPTKRS